VQDYFQNQEWPEDDPLVLHYFLKSFAYYFPQLTLNKCGDVQLRKTQEMVKTIALKINENIQSTGLVVPLTAYWISKSIYPLYDTKKGEVPGRDFFIQTVQVLFDHFIHTEDVFHAEWIITDMAECRYLDWPDYEQKVRAVADIYFDQGKHSKGIKAWHLLRQAGILYEKLNDHVQLDQCLRLIKDKKDNFEPEFQGSFQLPEEVQNRLDERCRIIAGHLTSQKEQCSCFDLLAYFFGTQRIPKKRLIQKSAKSTIPLSYDICTLEYMTEGRSGSLPCGEDGSDEGKIEHWNLTIYLNQLSVIHYPELAGVWNWLVDNYSKDHLIEATLQHYQASLLYEPERSYAMANMINNFLENDWPGFIYPATMQIEHFLRLYLHKIGHNVSIRNLRKMENQSLGKILISYEKPLEKQFSPDFMFFLWALFGSEYGLNIRNSLAHGLGITYLNSYYALLIWYALGFIWYHTPQVVGIR
jgi:hypothetical protein